MQKFPEEALLKVFNQICETMKKNNIMVFNANVAKTQTLSGAYASEFANNINNSSILARKRFGSLMLLCLLYAIYTEESATSKLLVSLFYYLALYLIALRTPPSIAVLPGFGRRFCLFPSEQNRLVRIEKFIENDINAKFLTQQFTFPQTNKNIVKFLLLGILNNRENGGADCCTLAGWVLLLLMQNKAFDDCQAILVETGKHSFIVIRPSNKEFNPSDFELEAGDYIIDPWYETCGPAQDIIKTGKYPLLRVENVPFYTQYTPITLEEKTRKAYTGIFEFAAKTPEKQDKFIKEKQNTSVVRNRTLFA